MRGGCTIERNSFIQMNKLHNVRGRITYISSHAKQENLYAVYETTDRHYWTELARFNQQEFLKSGTEGKCIEARELIIALPESFPDLYDPDRLLQLFTNRFKEKYGVECVSALHHNKRKTNYHIRSSIKVWGNRPDLLSNIIRTAIMRLALLISEVLTAARKLKNKLFHKSLEKEYDSKAIIKAENTSQPYRSKDKGAR